MSDASVEGLAAALDLQTVRVVRQISEHGSLTAAAEALGYSQPAVSQQLRRFEERTGIALVERVGRGIRLTQSGRVLARHANAVATAIEAAAGELAEIRGLRAGRVRLVAFPSASATLVPRLIAALGAAHPGIAVTYVEAEPPEAVAAVRADRADLAITFSYPGDRDDPHRASARGLERGRHGVRVAREHPARLGEADAASHAFDERDARALLEAAQLLAHRGLAVAERLGRGGQRAVLGDLAHDAHGLEVEGGGEAVDGGVRHA